MVTAWNSEVAQRQPSLQCQAPVPFQYQAITVYAYEHSIDWYGGRSCLGCQDSPLTTVSNHVYIMLNCDFRIHLYLGLYTCLEHLGLVEG